MPLHELLALPREEKHVVSLCGAGGKTTLLYALARETRETAPTAVFTTTHILPPEEGEELRLLCPFSEAVCRRTWKRGQIAAAGTFLAGEGKLAPPPEEVVAFLLREAGAVFIEADGSRCLPLKFPAPWEPVLRTETTHVVVVAGLSALGRPAEEVIHRLDLARETMEIPAGAVSEETMAELLWRGYGRFDPVFLLNQADTPALRERGERTAERLRSLGARRAAVTALQPKET